LFLRSNLLVDTRTGHAANDRAAGATVNRSVAMPPTAPASAPVVAPFPAPFAVRCRSIVNHPKAAVR
jgi:hypothetical protein